MKTVVLTSDHHNWLLRGFFHQWRKYAAGYPEIEVAGFTPPDNLPQDVGFHSIGKFEDYPVNKWSDAVIKYLNTISDDLVLILLEDYWLIRPVNISAIWDARDFMLANKNVIRFDVAADRMFSREVWYSGYFGGIDLCECKGQYSLSYQASIYRRELLLEVLRADETPWQSELNGSTRLNSLPYRVIGSYQWPMNYMIIMNKGQVDPGGQWMYPARRFTGDDWYDLVESGCLREVGLAPEETR